jgi:hypothetical protein
MNSPNTKATARSAVFPAGNAASIKLPLVFVLAGSLALVAGIAWLVADPSILATFHYNQHVIAVTHLFVLGWICSIVMGAMYQLVPVALETKLHREKLAWCQFVFHVTGFIGMVWMFRVWDMRHVAYFGSALATGVALFVYNIGRTLRRVPKWNVTATAAVAALCWISLAILAGLSIAIAKSISNPEIEGADSLSTAAIGVSGLLNSIGQFVTRFDPISAMHAHAHLGAVGCFTMLIVGISYKLIPMFTLSEIQNRRRAALSVVLLNLSLAGSVVTILIRSPWKIAFAISGGAALAVYAWELRAILRARKRRVLDWGIKYFLSAVVILLLVSVLGIVLSYPGLPTNQFTGQLENVYGFLGIVGAISFAIIGMLYKIVPFLVWFGRYSNQIGKQKVPALADMYASHVQAAGYWTFLAGLAITCFAILVANESFVRIGCCTLAASIACLAFNLILILSHFARPRLQPLTPAPSAVLKPV